MKRYKALCKVDQQIILNKYQDRITQINMDESLRINIVIRKEEKERKKKKKREEELDGNVT